MVHLNTCIPLSSGKTSCRGSTLCLIALTVGVHNESLKCERLKMQKDRRRPDTCHPFHPEVSTPWIHTQISQYDCIFFHDIFLTNSAFLSWSLSWTLSRRTQWSAEELWVSPPLLWQHCCASSWLCALGDQSWPRLSIQNLTWIGLARHAKESQRCHREKHSCPL